MGRIFRIKPYKQVPVYFFILLILFILFKGFSSFAYFEWFVVAIYAKACPADVGRIDSRIASSEL
jgi:hypothetical protein